MPGPVRLSTRKPHDQVAFLTLRHGSCSVFYACRATNQKVLYPMKIVVVIDSNDAEIAWNALRFATT